MNDIVCIDADKMKNRSFSLVDEMLSQVLNIINDRLDNASDDGLVQRQIILEIGQLPKFGPKYKMSFLARDLSDFLDPIGYRVELSRLKANNIFYYENIIISW